MWAFGCVRNAMLSGPKQQHPVDAGKRRRVWNPALPVHRVTTVSRGSPQRSTASPPMIQKRHPWAWHTGGKSAAAWMSGVTGDAAA